MAHRRPPDALMVPRVWFEEPVPAASLYFFDPTARILVPEPVFVPGGDQVASSLVNGLLAGPAPTLAGSSGPSSRRACAARLGAGPSTGSPRSTSTGRPRCRVDAGRAS